MQFWEIALFAQTQRIFDFFKGTLILAFEVIVQPPKTHFFVQKPIMEKKKNSLWILFWDPPLEIISKNVDFSLRQTVYCPAKF